MKYSQSKSTSEYFYIDCYVHPQHGGTVSPDYLKNVFGQPIRDSDHFVAVMSPWDNPVPLSRIWCIYEFHTAITHKKPFEVVFTAEEDGSWAENITDTDLIVSKYSEIDSRNAEASKPADKANILQLIEEGVGTKKLNAEIMQKVRDLLVDKCMAYLAKEPRSEVFGLVCNFSPSKTLLEQILVHKQRVLDEAGDDDDDAHFDVGMYHSVLELFCTVVIDCQAVSAYDCFVFLEGFSAFLTKKTSKFCWSNSPL